nr:hypothetical protein [Tanacetum cinerariifolium]
MARRPLSWKVVEHVSHKKFSNGGVIVEEDDPDVIHVGNSSDLALSASLNDLEIAALYIDGQSIDVDAPPDIIDVVDEDDDIIDEEDPIPHDLGDSDDEDLVNLDIDGGVNVVYSNVARGHDGDGGGDDRPLSYHVPTGCGGCLGNRGKGTRKPNLGETLMPLGDHAARWANYIVELVRELPLHYPSWRQMPPERKAGVVAKIGFDLRPHMKFNRWPQIYVGNQQHLQKFYNGKKTALKERYWVPEEDKTYDLERIRRGRPSHIFEVDWDAQLAFWNDPRNLARAAQNKQNLEKSKVICRQRSRFIPALRDMHMETSATREYMLLIHTFFLTHTVGGVFLNPEDKALYDEMLRLQGLGSNTPTGVPHTEDEIMGIVREGKQRGHIPGVGRVLPGQGTVIPPPSQTGVTGAGMMSQEMMRMATRMRTRVKGCWIEFFDISHRGFPQKLRPIDVRKKEEEEKQIAKEQAAKARYWKILICYDDYEDYTIAITPKELDNSLRMGDEHLGTILAMESDEFIKSSVENLVPNPSESKGEHECDVPACDDFTTFSNLLFDVDDDFTSSNDESFSDEDISKKIYSNPLFDEEIISMKIDPHHFNAESDLIESLLNQDSLVISSSSKIDYLLDDLLKDRGSPGRNKTLGPWSARIPMWQLFKGLGGKMIENGAKTDIFEFVSFESA